MVDTGMREFVSELENKRTSQKKLIDGLVAEHIETKKVAQGIAEGLEARGVSKIEVKLRANHRAAAADAEALAERIKDERKHLADLDERIADLTADVQRSMEADDENLTESARRLKRASATGGQGGRETEARSWARRAAAQIQSLRGESRAMTSGAVDVPNLVEPTITPMARPARLTDLLVSRKALSGNAFEYFKQTTRTNNAAPTPDLGLKPTSVLTTTAVSDRARVIAHLSEATPQRLLVDVEGLESWLISEMAEGVLDALEYEVIQGSGSGEHLTGLLPVGTTPNGTRPIAFATDAPTTLRKALTALQTAGEMPNAVVLSPADAEAIDLTRWGASGGFLSGGFGNDTGNGFGTSANIFGGPEIQRVISPSMPTGIAVLGDWSKVCLYIRESVNVAFDFSGDNFSHNSFVARAETRVGVGWLRPSAFAIADLTA